MEALLAVLGPMVLFTYQCFDRIAINAYLSVLTRPAAEWLKLAHKVEQALAGQGDLLEAPDAEVEAIVAKVRAREAAPGPMREGAPEPAAGERAAAKGDEDRVAIHTDRVEVADEREAGPVHVGLAFWKRLNLEAILRDAGLDGATRALTLAMAMNRLIAPAAENAMPELDSRDGLGRPHRRGFFGALQPGVVPQHGPAV